MSREQKILSHPLFQSVLGEIDALERERTFCRHGLPHLMDTARLLQHGEAEFSSEVLWAAALLHDIGRGEQYIRGTSHELAALPIAREILTACGYTPRECAVILDAIADHRTPQAPSALGRLLYRADKQSRPCWKCKAREACNWPEEKKNPAPDPDSDREDRGEMP